MPCSRPESACHACLDTNGFCPWVEGPHPLAFDPTPAPSEYATKDDVDKAVLKAEHLSPIYRGLL